MRNLDTVKENTWCTGCGNFGILNSLKKALINLEDNGVPLTSIVITCGIGCHGKIFDYINISGFYSLHGRALATAQGIKLANPGLNVVSFGGDGDSLGEGLEHTLFAAKRNADVTLILHNNGTYGLTTGQASPLSNQGYKGLSTPNGNIEQPFSVVSLLMEAGATFVARTYSARPEHATNIFINAIRHKGFSIVEVLQPCVSYNNTYLLYNQKVKQMEVIPSNDQNAIALAKDKDNIYIGVFRQEHRDVYHELLYRDYNPSICTKNHSQRKEILATFLGR